MWRKKMHKYALVWDVWCVGVRSALAITSIKHQLRMNFYIKLFISRNFFDMLVFIMHSLQLILFTINLPFLNNSSLNFVTWLLPKVSTYHPWPSSHVENPTSAVFQNCHNFELSWVPSEIVIMRNWFLINAFQ